MARGDARTWPCSSSPRRSSLERPSKCSTMASTDAISPMLTILSKGSFASWTVRLREIPTGTATSPIPEPAGLLGGSITSGTTARSSSWTTLTPSKDLWVKKAKVEYLPLQPGDVPDTYADVEDLVQQFCYKPSTPISLGISSFVAWYHDYFKR